MSRIEKQPYIKSADETSDEKDGMKCNCEMKITRVCEANADMCGNTDDVNSVRGTILNTKNDGMTNVGCYYQRETKVSIWILKRISSTNAKVRYVYAQLVKEHTEDDLNYAIVGIRSKR
ncbi:5157_t:CDS:2 [Gigaspora rosea]|nr:5157_t:CDS:2 [Gigaspora rosea]